MAWAEVKNTLMNPDERQLTRGIASTNVPAHLQAMVDALVWESTRGDQDSTGACLESLLKNDILGTLVSLSEDDRPFGIQAEVLKSIGSLVVLMDEQFLVHAAVHKAVLRLLRVCVGDLIDDVPQSSSKAMGAASVSQKSSIANYEEDLVDLLCTLCSRIRTYRELLMIFFHDKHWFQYQNSSSRPDEEEDEEEVAEEEAEEEAANRPARSLLSTTPRAPSPASSVSTVTASAPQVKPEYEFLLFNYLLRFVHREGKIGDLARAGLLFLLDVAMSVSDQPNSPTQDGATRPDPTSDAALALAEYVLDGDFPEVLGAGLAAIYSVLPYKLEIQRDYAAESEVQHGGMLLGGHHVVSAEDEAARLEEAEERGRELNIGISTSTEFRGRLDHLLKMAEFIQDVLKRNDASVRSSLSGESVNAGPAGEATLDPSALVGSAISDAILRAFRAVFLENVLYPSLLECSDADGSAVAVLSYIESLLRTLRRGRLSDTLVSYLMSEGTDTGRSTEPAGFVTRATKMARRKSSAMTLLEREPANKRQSTYFSSLGRFTLKDLIFSNLHSEFSSTATASLKLLHCLLEQHCEMCTDQLLSVLGDPHATAFPAILMSSILEELDPPALDSDSDEEFVYPGGEETTTAQPKTPPPFTKLKLHATHKTTTYATHERELGLYLSLVSRINPSNELDVFSTGYENYVRDAMDILQSEVCYCRTLDGDPTYTGWKHRLQPGDALLKLLLHSLRHFFMQTPEFNVALTGVLSAISSCPNRSMVGWLSFDTESLPLNSEATQSPGDGDDRSIDSVESLKAAPTSVNPNDAETRPVIYDTLLGLVIQLERYRARIPDFDRHLTERRQGLLFSENISDALNLDLSFELASDSGSHQLSLLTPETPQRPKSKPGSGFMSFLSKKNKPPSTPTPAEPSTPPRDNGSKVIPATPFTTHYQSTSAVDLDGFAAAEPITGPWASSKKKSNVRMEDDVFTAWKESDSTEEGEPRQKARKDGNRITLSQLLDNTVILEEFMKEIAGIIQARRSLGIDAIRIFD